MPDFIQDYDWSGFAGRSAKIALVTALALVFLRLGTRLVDRSVRSIGARSPLREASPRLEQRAETLAGVAKSMVRIVVWSVAVLLILEEFGLNLGPLIAGASIVGVALGFGAQSLVKDFFSGFFILVEDQYAVGDVITIADQTGTVEEINLRVTRIRAVDGTVWFVPNGEIRKVGNAAKEWAKSIVTVVVPHKADLGAATAAIVEEASALAADAKWADSVLEEPEVAGVESLGAENITLRVSTKVKPAQKVAFARELRARVGRRLQAEGLLETDLPPRRPSPES